MEILLRIRLFISLLLLVIAIGCSDDPNSVGNALIPENDKLKILTIDSETDSFEQEFVSFRKDSLFFGNSKRLLLGEYRNVSSDVLLRFFIILPDSIKTLLESTDSVSLRSSWIELYPDYWLGDKSSVDFLVNEIQTSWNPVEFNEDSLSLVQNSLGSSILENT